ncbi:MAG: hypothetical protein ACP5JO_08400 [Candidatus Ratteibacteria bacterium]
MREGRQKFEIVLAGIKSRKISEILNQYIIYHKPIIINGKRT